jgi:hypothetical protein
MHTNSNVGPFKKGCKKYTYYMKELFAPQNVLSKY